MSKSNLTRLDFFLKTSFGQDGTHQISELTSILKLMKKLKQCVKWWVSCPVIALVVIAVKVWPSEEYPRSF